VQLEDAVGRGARPALRRRLGLVFVIALVTLIAGRAMRSLAVAALLIVGARAAALLLPGMMAATL
jgi:hypothetical protein